MNTLFDTGDTPPKTKPTKKPPRAAKPKEAPRAVGRGAVPGPLRWGIAATLDDALSGLAPDRKAAVLEKALFALSGWELDAIARIVRDFLRADLQCGTPGK